MSKPIAIYGAGGFGREVLTLIEHINAHEKEWDFIGFFDDMPNIDIANESYLGDIDALNNFDQQLAVVLANGNSCIRYSMFNKINNSKIYFPILIHPNVVFGRREAIEIARGSVICAGSTLTLDIKLGEFSLINLNTTIGHNSSLGKFTSVMPGVNIAGDVEIGEQVYIGSGANIINGKSIGALSKVGAGAVVHIDVPTGTTAVGVPVRIIADTK